MSEPELPPEHPDAPVEEAGGVEPPEADPGTAAAQAPAPAPPSKSPAKRASDFFVALDKAIRADRMYRGQGEIVSRLTSHLSTWRFDNVRIVGVHGETFTDITGRVVLEAFGSCAPTLTGTTELPQGVIVAILSFVPEATVPFLTTTRLWTGGLSVSSSMSS